MLKQKFLNFLKSLTIAKLFRWGIKSAIFLWAALVIIFSPQTVYKVASSYNEDYFIWGHDGFADPKKYIWFIVPMELFRIFFSCYFIADVWYRKNNVYLFAMMILFFAGIYIVGTLDHKLLFLTTFWW